MRVTNLDILIDGCQAARNPAVERIQDDWILDVPNADILVHDIVYQAAPTHVRLDADAVVGPVDGQVGYSNGTDSAFGLAADGHAMPGVEVISQNCHVRCGAGLTGLNGYVVVPGTNPRV